MAVGVYNPHHPGETVWLFGHEDLEGLIPDDIYKYVADRVEKAEMEMYGFQDEAEEWQRWHDEHLEDDSRLFHGIIDTLNELLQMLHDQKQKVTRKELISRLQDLKELVNSNT